MAKYPMPVVAEMVSATISVSHIMPNEKRTPTKILGNAPGKITSLNNAQPVKS